MPFTTASLALAAVGVVIGYVYRQFSSQDRSKAAESKAQKLVERAEIEAKELIRRAKDEVLKIREKVEKEEAEKRAYLLSLEKDLRVKERALSERSLSLDFDRKKLDERVESIAKVKDELRELRVKQEASLERISKLKKDEAKKIILDLVERQHQEELASRIQGYEEAAKQEGEARARKVVATVLSRIASDQTAEATVMTVAIPNDEMKGRIIGKEGRNIHAFEKATGVDLIIDDSPDTVIISSFDPVRRELGRIVLERLIQDGRIHPTRIEEMTERTEKELNQLIQQAGIDAATEAKVRGLPADILKILGRLKFRTSYGQNQLRHAVEVASIAGLLAEELGADAKISRTAGLLHDIGKAFSQEVPGPHHHISMDIARKYGLSDQTINAIGAHHDDVEAETVEALIVRSADAISGARPGARRESLESYVKRLTDLENIANSFEGVNKSYAIQAGREVRIIVEPGTIDDLSAAKLAKNIAQKIEQEMQYPGQIKVNVIRETRVIEFAR